MSLKRSCCSPVGGCDCVTTATAQCEVTLHLADGQISVQPVDPLVVGTEQSTESVVTFPCSSGSSLLGEEPTGQQQQFGQVAGQEEVGGPSEPTVPVLL